MDWLVILIALVAVYAIVAYFIFRKKLWTDTIVFYGPVMAIRSRRVGFFDRLTRFHRFFRVYGTFGAVMVILVSVAMVGTLFYSLYLSMVYHPAPTAVNDVRNFLAIPGVNQFIPFTVAVWFAFVFTLVVHEFGHAFLARVEKLKVSFIGILWCVIPIGAFVEPDEKEFENLHGLPKIRMLGAGITNNMVAGLACFLLLILLLGFAVPLQTPLINSVYKDYPADRAGIVPDSVITSINGVPVATETDVASILNTTRPGDQVVIVTEKDGTLSSHALTLDSWPQNMSQRESGFMGVTYYDAGGIKQVFSSFASPLGFFIMLAIPIYIILSPVEWGQFLILVNDSANAVAWSVPFPGYWFVVQILFWCAWFNITVGLCNAIPMLPFDGGYIFKEGIDRLLDRRGLIRYSGYIVGAVSYLMIVVLISLFLLPTLQHM
ncbi:site-2 protease family protein [Methanoregula sp.]|uniref:site-2 protease family protein n=1 Tax=Methanoregula sp. TaxID=2052170 RepID=UPI002B7133D6|nr:site-2 protease family protein [Methanoregula sp.]HVP97179.1 site-2 protease family protein [Methanoregula sp.]